MTERQEEEFNVLGCKVKYRPDDNDSHIAKTVINQVLTEVQSLKVNRPMLKDTDVAVLVALKMATEKKQLEDEYRSTVLKLESSLESALSAMSPQAN